MSATCVARVSIAWRKGGPPSGADGRSSERPLPVNMFAQCDMASVFRENPQPQLLVAQSSMRILDANDAALRLYGYTHAALLKLNLYDLHCEQDLVRLESAVLDHSGRRCRAGKWRHLRRDGTAVPVRVYPVSMAWGHNRIWLWSIEDLTDLEFAEKRAKAASRELEELRSHSPIAICEFDPLGCELISATDALRHSLGCRREGDRAALDPLLLERAFEDAGDWATFLSRASEGEPFVQQVPCRRFDGTRCTLRIHAYRSSYEHDGAPRMVLLVEDLTTLKLLEQRAAQAGKMEALGQMASAIAHDFNNVLTLLSGYSEILCSSLPASSAEREIAERLLGAVKQGSGITKQLLCFSRSETQAPELVEINKLLLELQTAIIPGVLGKAISCRMRLAKDDLQVQAVPAHLQQVVLNLITNARDAMPGGGVLMVRTMPDWDGAQKHCVLEVCDTGVGMDRATRERLFERFFTTKDKGKGVGIGLASVHSIVTQMNGSIEVDSELGVGTTFRIRLPLAPATESALHAVAQGITRAGEPGLEFSGAGPTAADGPMQDGGGVSVLLVDDDRQIREMVRSFLVGQGYEVTTCDSGTCALERVRANVGMYRLLISDVSMPGMSGLDLLREVRALQPDVPVLLMSGRDLPESERLADGTEFISKPFSLVEIGKAVALVMGHLVVA